MSQILEAVEVATPPKNLKPKSAEEKVQSDSLAVDVRHQLEPGEVEEIKAQFGLENWSPHFCKQLSTVGIDCERFGISRINNGALMVVREANLVAIQILQKRMAETKSVNMQIKIAHAIAKLTASVSDTVKASSVDSVAASMVSDGKVRRASPAKGAVMGPSNPPTVTVLPDVKSA